VTGASTIRWARTPDKSVWAWGAPGGALLTVTRTSGGRWLPAAAGVTGPDCRSRLEAQRWCERQVTS
jgi:hypothetical protein